MCKPCEKLARAATSQRGRGRTMGCEKVDPTPSRSLVRLGGVWRIDPDRRRPAEENRWNSGWNRPHLRWSGGPRRVGSPKTTRRARPAGRRRSTDRRRSARPAPLTAANLRTPFRRDSHGVDHPATLSTATHHVKVYAEGAASGSGRVRPGRPPALNAAGEPQPGHATDLRFCTSAVTPE
jgi:hypothetical protein